jgi:asparagine N-glycosylation enzyme membrane subunit Stt3
MIVAFLALMAGGIWFWSGRPELLAIVLVGALIKFVISEAKRR